MNLQKLVGRTVEIIYQDKDGKFSKRSIRVERIDGELIRAYCYTAKGPRVFRIDNVLAALPVVRRRVG